MKNCFIFSGQGSHRPGMSLNLYNTFQIAKDRIELSNKILGYDISEIMFSAEENVLRQTQYAQPAIFIHSTILFDLIKDQKINIYAGCGIVIDSNPEEETDELKWKLLPLIDSLK